MDEKCKNYIECNIQREQHICDNEKRLEFYNNTKNDILTAVHEYLAIYRSLISSCKTACQLNVSYYSKCHALNCEKVSNNKSHEMTENDILSVLSFYCNSVFNVAQSMQTPVNNNNKSTLKTSLKKKRSLINTLSDNIPETERGLLSVAGGTLADIYKKAIGKRHFRIKIKRHHQSIRNDKYRTIVCALKMNGDEKTNAPASLLCCDKGGLVVPKLCLLPYIRLVIGKVMQYATS